MRAFECLQSLLDFHFSVCFLSIQSLIDCLTTIYGKPSTGSGLVNGVSAPFFASSSVMCTKKLLLKTQISEKIFHSEVILII